MPLQIRLGGLGCSLSGTIGLQRGLTPRVRFRGQAAIGATSLGDPFAPWVPVSGKAFRPPVCRGGISQDGLWELRSCVNESAAPAAVLYPGVTVRFRSGPHFQPG